MGDRIMGLKEYKEFVEDMISEVFAREAKRTNLVENLLKEEPATMHFVGADSPLSNVSDMNFSEKYRACVNFCKSEQMQEIVTNIGKMIMESDYEEMIKRLPKGSHKGLNGEQVFDY